MRINNDPRQTGQRVEQFKYILLHPDGSFKRVYPTNVEEKKQLISADRLAMMPNNMEGNGASSIGELVFIVGERCRNGLEYNDVASQLAGFNLYGTVLIEDRNDRFESIA